MNKPIGQIIKEVFETSGISKQEFGDRIYCSRQNVYSIFQKKNIDIGLLRRISDVLNYDFFAYLSEDGKRGQMKRPSIILVDGLLWTNISK